MLDQFEDLENKINTLIEALHQSNERIRDLEKENLTYREMLDETEVASNEMQNRENVIKNKLEHILEKMDSIEVDLNLFSEEHA